MLNIKPSLSLLFWLALLPAIAQASGISFKAVSLGADDGIVLLDIAEQYTLTPKLQEALENGVPLTFVTQINMQQENDWRWNTSIMELDVTKVLSYQPLADQYRVDDLHQKIWQMYATQEAALRALGEIRDLTLIEERLLEKGKRYFVNVQTQHDVGALPLPLRPMAYALPAWHLSSKLWEWQLKP